MTNLSDTQHVILTAAWRRADRLVLPLPDRLRGGAAAKVVGSLIAKGLIEEVEAKRGKPFWRETGDKHGVTLVATDAAFAALGIEPSPAAADAHDTEPALSLPATVRRGRADTKQAQLVAMLKRRKGASIEEIGEKFGWQAHTVRGAIAGALKKKLGLDVISEKIERRGRVYRIA
ncbi:MAG: DUF3489 domain-containing protein [Candidatus Binatus sp.]